MSTDPADTGSQSQSLSATQSNAAYVPKRIDEYLQEVLSRNGSDLHFVAGDPPRIRLFGDLNTLREQKLTQEVVRTAMFEIMPRTAMNRFEQKDGADFAYSIPGVSRFRVNVFRHIAGIGAVFRAIPAKALSLDQLNMPEAVRSLSRLNSGLILVTGRQAPESRPRSRR
jgi:twitching motility protein PilT